MPHYLFRCVMCGNEELVALPVNFRDSTSIYCESTNCKPTVPGGKCRMVRQPAAPNFTVSGYSAKNGYAK